MEEKAYVYKIRNKTNGKLYIGSSKRIDSRLYTHRYELKRNIHCNKKLQGAWNKYGEDNFEFEIIEECNLENQYVREQYHMDLHDVCKTGYNILPTAKYGHADGQPWVKGEENITATITNEQAILIKKLICEGYGNSEISKITDINSSTIRNIKDLQSWIDVGKEYNSKIKDLKNCRRFDIETNAINLKIATNEYLNGGISKKDIIEKYNISNSMLQKELWYENARRDGRTKACIMCGKEIILKRKNSNKKYCEKCAETVNKEQSVLRQRKLRSK